MKRTFILIVSVIAIFAACKKTNKNYTHCYVCQGFDSIVYNFPPYLVKDSSGTDTPCGETDVSIAYYMKTHTRLVDTLYHKPDSLVVQYTRFSNCEVP